MHVVLVYLQPFRRNSVLKCVLQPKTAKKFTKTTFLRGSRSFKVIGLTNLKSPLLVLVMICSMSVPISNRFHAIRANNGKITSF